MSQTLNPLINKISLTLIKLSFWLIIDHPAAGAVPRRHPVVKRHRCEVEHTTWRLFSLKLAQNYKLLHHQHEKQNKKKQKLSFLLFLFLHKRPSGKSEEQAFQRLPLNGPEGRCQSCSWTQHFTNWTLERKKKNDPWSELICSLQLHDDQSANTTSYLILTDMNSLLFLLLLLHTRLPLRFKWAIELNLINLIFTFRFKREEVAAQDRNCSHPWSFIKMFKS